MPGKYTPDLPPTPSQCPPCTPCPPTNDDKHVFITSLVIASVLIIVIFTIYVMKR